MQNTKNYLLIDSKKHIPKLLYFRLFSREKIALIEIFTHTVAINPSNNFYRMVPNISQYLIYQLFSVIDTGNNLDSVRSGIYHSQTSLIQVLSLQYLYYFWFTVCLKLKSLFSTGLEQAFSTFLHSVTPP